jgi:hypothetical protein
MEYIAPTLLYNTCMPLLCLNLTDNYTLYIVSIYDTEEYILRIYVVHALYTVVRLSLH